MEKLNCNLKAAPEEFIFESKGRGHNTVGDVIRTVRENFKITHETLLLLLDEDRSRVLVETEKIENSRTYIVVKRKPSMGKIKHCSNRKKKKRQKVLYQP